VGCSHTVTFDQKALRLPAWGRHRDPAHRGRRLRRSRPACRGHSAGHG
jgi:hypothetical protein